MAGMNLHDLVVSADHAPPSHPIRALLAHKFYLEDWVSSEGGLSLVMLNALLLVPLVLFAMFYPMQALIAVGALLLVSFIAFEGVVIWRRHGRVKS